jgi:glycosyltransferase involved in cell wall biosynthesis
MSKRIEFVVATTGQKDLDFAREMNLHVPAVITNQCGEYRVLQEDNIVMVSTPTCGVGVNRNIGINLTDAEYAFIVDDDMVFYDNAIDILNQALEVHPDADVIIFGFDYVKDSKIVRKRMRKSERVKLHNCLHYGICCALIKVTSIRQNNISFTTFFGGGCLYGSGEDSLFYLECVRKNLKIYTYAESVGMNQYRESTWFKGYNNKFFYDKGAWIACAFPKIKFLMICYFTMRFKRCSELPVGTIVKRLSQGAKGYGKLAIFKEDEI